MSWQFHFEISRMGRGTGVLLIAALLEACCTTADVITIDTIDRGSYRDDGYRVPWYKIYGVGRVEDYYRRNFLLFDLSSITLPVISAELRLVNNHSYDSTDPFETYTVFDVTTPLGDLVNAYGDTVATFNDLGSGTVYGSVDVPSNDNYVVVSVALNADGLSALNASLGGMFAVGGAVTTLDSPESRYEGLFSLSDPDRPGDGATQLVLTLIPEPGTISLLALGGLTVWARMRRRRHEQPPSPR